MVNIKVLEFMFWFKNFFCSFPSFWARERRDKFAEKQWDCQLITIQPLERRIYVSMGSCFRDEFIGDAWERKMMLFFIFLDLINFYVLVNFMSFGVLYRFLWWNYDGKWIVKAKIFFYCLTTTLIVRFYVTLF